MSMLKAIERELMIADRRLERERAGAAGSVDRRLRGRWRRLGRGGRAAGILAGGLVLGAVATGSAQVAGLDPWGKLVGQDQIDPALRPVGGAGGAVGIRVADAPGRPGWELRAYVARNGKLCVVAAGRGGEGLYDCRTSDQAAAVFAGRRQSGPPLAGVTQTAAPTMRPKRVVAWALTSWSQPPAQFEVPAGGVVRTRAAVQPLRVTVDHSSTGLSRRGIALLATLPQELTLRLTVAEVSFRTPLTNHGDVIVLPPAPAPPGRPTVVQVTSATAWSSAHGGRSTARVVDGVLDRSSEPVTGATDRQLRTFPVLARPPRAGDSIPSSLLTDQLRAGRIQPAASRRLIVTGLGDLGPVWLAPGGIPDDFTVPTLDGMVCLVGPTVLSGCEATSAVGRLPDPETVVCARGLPKDQVLVRAFVPAGADRVRVDYASGPSASYAAGDLLVLLQSRTARQPTQLEWSGPNHVRALSRVVFPPHAESAVCGPGPAPHYSELRRSLSSSGESHRP